MRQVWELGEGKYCTVLYCREVLGFGKEKGKGKGRGDGF